MTTQQALRLKKENQKFSGTGSVSHENAHLNFSPAFMDQLSGEVDISRFGNGTPAPFHSLEGVPDEWAVERSVSGRVVVVKDSVVSGFVRLGRFFTREEAADFMAQSFV